MKVITAYSINASSETGRKTIITRALIAREVVLMNLISMFNINDERKPKKSKEKHSLDRDYGYSVYESLEFNKDNQARCSLGIQILNVERFIRY